MYVKIKVNSLKNDFKDDNLFKHDALVTENDDILIITDNGIIQISDALNMVKVWDAEFTDRTIREFEIDLEQRIARPLKNFKISVEEI